MCKDFDQKSESDWGERCHKASLMMLQGEACLDDCNF